MLDTKRGEPAFEPVDSPGDLCPYTFRTKFTSRGAAGTYLHHEMPAGAQVIQKNAAGVRGVNEAEGKCCIPTLLVRHC